MSTRENSIDTVIQRPIGTIALEKDPTLCNGTAGQLQQNVTSVSNSVNSSSINNRVDSVSSFDKNSTLNNHASAIGSSSTTDTSSAQETKRMAYDPAINERINPFDKDKIAASRAATAAPAICSTFSSSTFTTITTTSGATGGYSSYVSSTSTLSSSSVSQPPAEMASASSSSYSSTSNITTSDKGDDNVKDRYNIQQGIRDQSQAGRIGPQTSATVAAANISTTSSYSSETKKQEFGRTKRSSSDAELIFGDKGPDFYKPRFSVAGMGRDSKQSSDSLSDAETIFGTSAVSGPPSASSVTGGSAAPTAFNRYTSYGSRDSSSFNSSVSDSDYIYGKKDDRSSLNKSLSVSSEKADVDVTERFRGGPRSYEPPKSASSVGSSASGKWGNKYEEDDFDLK